MRDSRLLGDKYRQRQKSPMEQNSRGSSPVFEIEIGNGCDSVEVFLRLEKNRLPNSFLIRSALPDLEITSLEYRNARLETPESDSPTLFYDAGRIACDLLEERLSSLEGLLVAEREVESAEKEISNGDFVERVKIVRGVVAPGRAGGGRR